MSNRSVSEERLKLAVRDVVGRNPLISVRALQNELKEKGFQTQQGNPLGWQYVAKVVRKLNREKAFAVDQQKVNERLAETKESDAQSASLAAVGPRPARKRVVVGCLQAPEVGFWSMTLGRPGIAPAASRELGCERHHRARRDLDRGARHKRRVFL